MGYKWKEVQKGVFFGGHKCKDVIKYQNLFLNEIKLLLPYFVEFLEDSIIASKEYLSDYIVGQLEKRLIIIIIHNKNTFSVNDGYKKV